MNPNFRVSLLGLEALAQLGQLNSLTGDFVGARNALDLALKHVRSREEVSCSFFCVLFKI